MTKKKKKAPADISQLAKFIVDETTVSTAHGMSSTNKYVSLTTKEKNPAAVALGRLGGLKGGKARAEMLSAKRRKAIAKKAAKTRWSKK
jgi:hypothetical protein